MTRSPAAPRVDTDEERTRHILDGQLHCDHFLTPLAEPRGKSVLVVGCGAGTDVLWALRRGARDVVGIDVVEQSPAALESAIAALELDADGSLGTRELRRLRIEEATALGRRFDLVLSNNVFEHVPRLADAFRACAELVEPDHGRVAIFTSPLYHSAAGAHLPLAPWEHLWGDDVELRRRLLDGELGSTHARHALEVLSLADYLDREISLNRMRLGDFLAALREAGLVILNLRLRCEPRLAELPAALMRLRERELPGSSATSTGGADRTELTATDLALEGIGVELVRLSAAPGELTVEATETVVRRHHEQELLALLAAAREEALRHQLDAGALRQVLAHDQERLHRASLELHRLRGIEASRSFRLGRALTAPLRWLRERFRR